MINLGKISSLETNDMTGPSGIVISGLLPGVFFSIQSNKPFSSMRELIISRSSSHDTGIGSL
jgi:hypothetical protein